MLPKVWEKVSHTDGPLPSSFTAPSYYTAHTTQVKIYELKYGWKNI